MSSTASAPPAAAGGTASAATTPTAAPTPAPGPGGGPSAAAAGKAPLFSAAAWAPLKVDLFRSLYIATSVAQIGTWAREAGSPALMALLTQEWANKPAMIGRITFYSNLPICLFSLLAGALADVLDRRRVLIWTHVWMIVVSAVLAFLTYTNHVTPWGLLGITFLLGVGTAATGPALQAVLPELVPPKDMALAINLNSVALNVARAVGPATFVLVVALFPSPPPAAKGQPVDVVSRLPGIATSYLLSAMTFAGAAWVLWRWKRAPQAAAAHGEGVFAAIRTGTKYVLHSPANRAILIRVMAFIVPAVVLWSQVPLIAENQLGMPRTPQSYAILFAFVGMGAILGVLLMPGLQSRFKIDPVVNVCILLYAATLVAMSLITSVWVAAFVLIFTGVNWVIIPTSFNTATQKSVPLWVKGRAISFYLTVLFGSFAIGGELWGRVTTGTSIHVSLISGGIGMAALLVLAKRYPLTINDGLDLTPAYPKGSTPPAIPVADGRPLPATGRVELTSKYVVDYSSEPAFHALLKRLQQQRLRNGAVRVRLDRGHLPGHYTETVVYRSKADFDRMPNRLTKADAKLQQEAAQYLARNEEFPVRVAGENLWI
ncbi:MAG TPA: MFS transporter [Humisphaera sp.]